MVVGERLIARKPPGFVPPGGAASAQLTSGTSGRTKVALRPVSALIAEAENYETALDMGPGTVLACPVPLHHAYGFGLAALAARWPARPRSSPARTGGGCCRGP